MNIRYFPYNAPSRSARERGISVILFCFIGGLALSFIALTLGVGFLMLGQEKFQNVTNLASLAAIEGYYRTTPGNSSPTQNERVAAAEAAALRVLSDPANRPVGLLNNLSGLQTYTSGKLEIPADKVALLVLGVWKTAPKKASDPLDTCSVPGEAVQNAPCFEPINPYSAGATRPNAARILAKTQPSNLLQLPMGKLLGVTDSQLEAEAISSIVPRCLAFAMDSSRSGHWESHRYSPATIEVESPIAAAAGEPTYRLNYAPDPYGEFSLSGYTDEYGSTFPISQPSKYAFPLSSLPADPWSGCPVGSPPAKAPDAQGKIYLNAPSVGTPWNTNSALWCSFPQVRPAPPAAAPYQHYKSDYALVDTPFGKYVVDKYHYPEPFRSILLSINQALKNVQTLGNAYDRSTIFSFAGNIYGKVPSGASLTSDLDFLIQLTDMTRMGRIKYQGGTWKVIGEAHPNFLDRGWVPNDEDAHTNIHFALKVAIDSIIQSTGTGECPKDSQKFIVLATDGIPDQVYFGQTPYPYAETDTMGYNNHVIDPNDATNGKYYYFSYNFYEKYLLRDNIKPKKEPFGGQVAMDPFGKQLADNQISVIALHAGNYTQPNFLNILDWTRPNDPVNGPFLDLERAAELGGRGTDTLEIYQENVFQFADIRPRTPTTLPPHIAQEAACSEGYNPNGTQGSGAKMSWLNSCAFKFAGQVPGMAFRQPAGTLMQLAIITKGYYCPLQPMYENTSCYDSTTKMWQPGMGCNRTPLQPQLYSLLGVEKGGQATACLSRVLDAPPFSLVNQFSWSK